VTRYQGDRAGRAGRITLYTLLRALGCELDVSLLRPAGPEGAILLELALPALGKAVVTNAAWWKEQEGGQKIKGSSQTTDLTYLLLRGRGSFEIHQVQRGGPVRLFVRRSRHEWGGALGTAVKGAAPESRGEPPYSRILRGANFRSPSTTRARAEFPYGGMEQRARLSYFH